jgi:beta-N-acetylhexosaminidase
VEAVQETILRLYGPEGTGQVAPEHISSLSFSQLKSILTGTLAESAEPPQLTDRIAGEDYIPPEEIVARIQAADWIIFVPLDLNTARYPDSDALKLFLAQGTPVLLDKRVVVLALNAPYYLDTTEISKLDAYFCGYSKTEPFIEAMVRVLFGEVAASGASPVNVEGVGYDLAEQLSPDPEQPLAVRLLGDVPDDQLPPVTLRVGVETVFDRNGNPVPDGTTVTFAASYRGGAGPVAVSTASTVSGSADATLVLPEPGQAEIVARSGEAITQRPLPLTVAAPPTPTPTTTPTPTPTIRPSPTPSATPSPTPLPAPTSTPTPAPTATLAPPPGEDPGGDAGGPAVRPVDELDLLMSLGATSLAAILAFSIPRRPRRSTTSGQVRLALLVLIGGLAGYLFYAMGWLRPETWLVPARESAPVWGRLTAALLAFAFGLVALVLEWPLSTRE